MSKERGFSLVEVLVGLLILTIVITTTIVMFTERHRRLRQANETILAYQALSNEVAIVGSPATVLIAGRAKKAR